jgi:hypothetical protein
MPKNDDARRQRVKRSRNVSRETFDPSDEPIPDFDPAIDDEYGESFDDPDAVHALPAWVDAAIDGHFEQWPGDSLPDPRRR